MKEAGKKAVVTGGAGFIGSHIAENLIAIGYGVSPLAKFGLNFEP